MFVFMLSADFFHDQLFFLKILSGIPSECQTVWIQIRPDILSGLIWVQTVCKGYQQTTLVGKVLRENIIEISLNNEFQPLSCIILCTTLLPNLYPTNLQHSSCKHVFSMRGENSVDPDQVTSSETS